VPISLKNNLEIGVKMTLAKTHHASNIMKDLEKATYKLIAATKAF